MCPQKLMDNGSEELKAFVLVIHLLQYTARRLAAYRGVNS